MLEKTHKLDLTLVWLTSDLTEVLFAKLSTFCNKNCAPEVLDKGVAEKVAPETVIVFLENAGKQLPRLSVLILLHIRFDRAGEKKSKHLDGVLCG